MRDSFKTVLNYFRKDKDVVVGAPMAFFFAGEHSVLRGGLGIVQRFPACSGGSEIRQEPRGKKNPVHIPRERGFHRIWLSGAGMLDFQDCQPPHGGSEWKDQTEPLENLVNGLLARSGHQALLEHGESAIYSAYSYGNCDIRWRL